MTAASLVLAPFAALYGALVETHSALYRRGMLRSARLAAPVISIGNITAGGTGKTPLVEHVARTVAAEGRKVCILTRGYGRKHPQQRVLVSDGQVILANELEAGDEPRLLAEKLLGVAAVISDADRYAAGQSAIADLGSEVFILDDGFQHLQLARDLNIVAIDATNPWGAGHLLPRGRLRELPRNLARADCVIVTRTDQVTDLELKRLQQEIKGFNQHCPVFTSTMKVTAVRSLFETTALRTDQLPPVAVFSAIGNHRSFVTLMKTVGLAPLVVSEFSDHHRYSQRDVETVIEKARKAGAKALVTTAKDAVKLRGLSFALPCYVMEIAISMADEEKFLELLRRSLTLKTNA